LRKGLKRYPFDAEGGKRYKRKARSGHFVWKAAGTAGMGEVWPDAPKILPGLGEFLAESS
jgi:hypothetical protein